MAFDGGIAASYLASFRPVTPVEGFENVLSNTATSTFGLIPFKNMELQGQLARDALQQRGLLTQQRELLNAQARENELVRRDSRKAKAWQQLAMAGDVFGLGQQDIEFVNPADLLRTMQGMFDERGMNRARRLSRPYAAAAAALNTAPQLG